MAEAARGPLSLFVTGTDTGVGKTLASTALLHALARHHVRVVGMKPVAAGTDNQWRTLLSIGSVVEGCQVIT